jgi:hypothetical protein
MRSNWGEEFAAVARQCFMQLHVRRADQLHRVILMVSKCDYFLRDLLYRWRKNALRIDVVGIVSNHEGMSGVAAQNGIPYCYLPVKPRSKETAENALRAVIVEHQVGLVALPRHMPILSDELSRELTERCIIIHHSFLPSVKTGLALCADAPSWRHAHGSDGSLRDRRSGQGSPHRANGPANRSSVFQPRDAGTRSGYRVHSTRARSVLSA